ncbi:MAG: peptidylprolyl isomerase [Microbacterium sp.]
MLRRIPAVLAVLGLSALTLAACSSSPASATCERSDSDASVLDFVTASGDFGTPAQTLAAPVYVDETIYTDVTAGDGLQVTTDAQDVVFSVAISNGATGETLISSGTEVQPLSGWREYYDGLADMMMCATEGSRVVGAIPASDLSEAAAESFGLDEDDSIVVTLDLQKVYLAAANGTPQFNARRGMPSVVLAPDGRPGIVIPDAAAPTELVVETLKKGDGAAITDDDTARVHYTAVSWDTGTVTTSTWETGASTAVTTASDVAFAAQLSGATVGSQLLVVVPAASEDETAMVYVIDILGIDDPETTTE